MWSRFWLMLSILSGVSTLCAAPATAPAGRAYSGWVHVHLRPLAAAKEADETAAPSDDEYPDLYLNKQEGSQFLIVNTSDGRRIQYTSAGRRERGEYDASEKCLFLGVLPPSMVDKTIDEVAKYPLTLDELLTLLKGTGAQIVSQTRSREATYDRIDIVYVGGSVCADARDQEGRDTVWVDPVTARIHKLRTRIGGAQEAVYTYETNPVTFYRLGVPLGAPVIDNRPAPATTALLDRLDSRFEQDFGDYVAVLTETDRRGTATQKLFVSLYARQGRALLNAIFDVKREGYPDSPLVELGRWPVPDIKEVLARAEKTIPLFFIAVCNGTGWTGAFDPAGTGKSRLSERTGPLDKILLLPEHRLVDHVWKSRESLFLYDFGPCPDILTDTRRPGAVALRIREGDFAVEPPPPQTRRIERIFWMDPRRNDVPLESIIRSQTFAEGGKANTVEFRYRYLSYTRLPNGLWVPTHWENQSSKRDFDGQLEGFTREFHLQIFPGMKLKPRWYGSRLQALSGK